MRRFAELPSTAPQWGLNSFLGERHLEGHVAQGFQHRSHVLEHLWMALPAQMNLFDQAVTNVLFALG